MLSAVDQAVRVGGREALDILKHGATREQMERHQYQEIDFGINTGNRKIDRGVKLIETAHNAIFRFMSASDRVFYAGAYKRNLIDRTLIAARNEGLRGEAMKLRAKQLEGKEEYIANAKHDALVSTFNNNNALSTAIKAARATVGKTMFGRELKSKRSQQRLNAAENLALDFILPFDRTPTNVISRILEASPIGYVKNAAQLVKAAVNKGMDVEDQRQFSQTFGRATAGTALIALGWKLADSLFDVDEKGIVTMKLGSHKIRLDYVSPLGNLVAAGVRLKKNHNEEKGLGADAKVVGREASNIPVLRATSGLSEMIQDPERSAAKSGARLVGGAVPFSGAVRFAAETLDPKERRAVGFKQNIQKNIPILRQRLPEDTAGSRRSLKTEMLERMRRGEAVDVDAAVRQDLLTKSDKRNLEANAKITATQQRFTNHVPSTALDRYERMNESERAQVKEIMEKKAWTLLNSDSVTEAQREDARKRIEALGIEPKNPRKQGSKGFTNPFTRQFRPNFAQP